MNPAKNISESVRQRILNKSKADKRPFMELLQYYAMERFLYRLTQSSYAQSYVLKGALMLRAWKSPEFRPTMDIDLLGITGNDEANIVAQVRDILAVETTPDGLTFEANSIRTNELLKMPNTKESMSGFSGSWEQPESACKLTLVLEMLCTLNHRRKSCLAFWIFPQHPFFATAAKVLLPKNLMP